jgi:uncharacterized protein GlcG (DUF336 family)
MTKAKAKAPMRQTRSSRSWFRFDRRFVSVARGGLAAALACVLALGVWSCGGDAGEGAGPPFDVNTPDDDRGDDGEFTFPQLQPDEVRAIMESAVRAMDPERDMAVAVTDRRGVILGVATTFGIDFASQCAALECPLTDIRAMDDFITGVASDCQVVELAVQLARTPSFFSAVQTPLTSRSVRFLSGEHFPAGIKNSGAAALFGIENTNRGCSFDAVTSPFETDIPRARSLSAVLRDIRGEEPLRCQSSADPADKCGCSRGIATLPGGVPIYKGNVGGLGNMVGGVGVAVRGVRLLPDFVAAFEETLRACDAGENAGRACVTNADCPGGGACITDPHFSTAVLRREFDDLALLLRRTTNLSGSEIQAAVDDFTLAEFAARAYAGDRVGFPVLEAKGIQNICDNEDIAPACCSASPPCFFNMLAVPPPIPFDPVIFVDGIEIPEVDFDPPAPAGAGTFARPLNFIVDPATDIDPDDPFRSARPVKASRVPMNAADRADALNTWLVNPEAPGNQASDSFEDTEPLTPDDVISIISRGVREALAIRAAIRLPLEARTAMVLAISDTNGKLLGAFRMNDATVFSIDVAIAKSRNVVNFSSPNIDPIDTMDCPGITDCRGVGIPVETAVTNRTLSFAAQPFFPSGIENRLAGFPEPYAPGPYRRTFLEDSANPCTNGREPANGRQNGIVFFPGSTPIYKNGVLVGGYGVSGDGVEQDDIVTFEGARDGANGNFLPAPEIRADQVFVRGVRLPFVKFNRAPDQ